MAKLELSLNASTLECWSVHVPTCELLGLALPPPSVHEDHLVVNGSVLASKSAVQVQEILAGTSQLQLLEDALHGLLQESKSQDSHHLQRIEHSRLSKTLELVFLQAGSSLSGEQQAIHHHLRCLAHIELAEEEERIQIPTVVAHITALECRRKTTTLHKQAPLFLLPEHPRLSNCAPTAAAAITNRFLRKDNNNNKNNTTSILLDNHHHHHQTCVMEMAVQHGGTGVLLTDADFRITWCNNAVPQMLGLQMDAIVGMFAWELPLQKEDDKTTNNNNNHNMTITPQSTVAQNTTSSSLSLSSSGNSSSSSDESAPLHASSSVKASCAAAAAPLEAYFREAKASHEAGFVTETTTSVATICYRIDNPSRPLHLNTSVRPIPPSWVVVRKDVHLMPTNHNRFVEEHSSHHQPHYMILLQDCTAQRRAQEFQTMAEQATAASEAKTQMMQMLSHELRTPLQGIMGVASTCMMDIEEDAALQQAAKHHLLPEDRPVMESDHNNNNNNNNNNSSEGEATTMYDSLSTILASSRLLLTLINNTLDTRKINADMLHQIELSPVSLLTCIQDTFQYCGPFATINEAMLELHEGSSTRLSMHDVLGRTGADQRSHKHLSVGSLFKSKKYNVIGNRLRLEQVIVNLLSNGVKHAAPGTSVVASVRQGSFQETIQEVQAASGSSLKNLSEDEWNELENDNHPFIHNERCHQEVTIFSVRDHGKGVPESEFDKVFGEFQQLDASARKDSEYASEKTKASNVGQSSGSGLGLNLAMKFLHMMHGHIWFENCTDGLGGVRFSFYLPTAPRVSLDRQDSCLSSKQDTSETRAGKEENADAENGNSLELAAADKMASFRVLVVDDSMINLKVLARMLNKLQVGHIHTALSGAAVLEYLEPIRSRPDLLPNLILCDLQMPGMDGYELMGHLRDTNICASAIIMACSADWGSETEGKCLDVGFDGLLRKPITVSNLKEFLTNTKLH